MSKIGSYDYHGLCNAFLTQSQSSGKTAGGRMSFTGTTLYSFDSKLAELDPVRKLLFIDSHIANYSRTSNTHSRKLVTVMSQLRLTMFYVDLSQTPAENLMSRWDELIDLVGKYVRARTTKPGYAKLITQTWNQALSYADLMKIDKRSKAYRRRHEIFQLLFTHKLLRN
jgi:hypothetical protein